jgi:hypothetical protein
MIKEIRTVPVMKTAAFNRYLPKKARKIPRAIKTAPKMTAYVSIH